MEALKTQDDDARSAITYLSDNYATKDNVDDKQHFATKQIRPAYKELKHVPQSSKNKAQRQSKSYPLGNPLLTSQLLVPKLQKLQTKEYSVEPNQDIKEMNGKEAGIGVGSVVLHLRKNRQQQQNGEVMSSQGENE